MTEGEVLEKYVEKSGKSKEEIALGLKVSLNTLYRYFKTVKMRKETKQRIEEYFNDKIFPDAKDNRSVTMTGNNGDVNIANNNKNSDNSGIHVEFYEKEDLRKFDNALTLKYLTKRIIILERENERLKIEIEKLKGELN